MPKWLGWIVLGLAVFIWLWRQSWWHVLQGAVFIAVMWGVIGYFDLPWQVLRSTPLWIVGAVAALWVTVVINSISRLRQLSKEGRRGYLWTWVKEVWAAEHSLPS
jgi:hypothetical protein